MYSKRLCSKKNKDLFLDTKFSRFSIPIVFARLLAVELGAAAIIVQTFLFRSFLSVFEGTELAIGIFFASWLIMVALGAVTGRRASSRIVDLFPFLLLLFIPAAGLQYLLFLSLRHIFNVTPYELFPLFKMALAALPANALLPFLIGFIFPAACTWEKKHAGLAVAGTYGLEALGGAMGGTLLTILLTLNAAPLQLLTGCFFIMLLLAALAAILYKKARWIIMLPVLLAVLWVAHVPDRTARFLHRTTWNALFPGTEYKGFVTTPQATYHYGVIRDQFFVSAWNTVVDTLPRREAAAETLALHFAQHPDAHNIAIVGDQGLAAACLLQQLQPDKPALWLPSDPAYGQQIQKTIPRDILANIQDLPVSPKDARRCLQSYSNHFDLIITMMPDPATLTINRFYTREFFSTAKQALKKNGIFSISISGGANYIGTELTLMGASALSTLRSVFPYTAIKAGETTYLLASANNGLSENAAELTSRYRRYAHHKALFPADAITTLYEENRIQFQRHEYEQIAPKLDVTNTDAHPRALLFSLLFALKQSGLPPGNVLPLIQAGHKLWIGLLCSLVVLFSAWTLLRFHTSTRSDSACRASCTDSIMLIAVAGFSGLSAFLIIMHAFQVRFGNLYLFIGLLSALYMAGLYVGTYTGMQAHRRFRTITRPLISLLLLVHVILLLALGRFVLSFSMWQFPAIVFLIGTWSGLYIPFAASMIHACVDDEQQAGAILEFSDHGGAAFGALFIGIIALPLWGISATLALPALCMGFLLLPMWTAKSNAHSTRSRLRTFGYAMFGVILALHLVSGALHMKEESSPAATAQTNIPEQVKTWAAGQPVLVQHTTNKSGAAATYYRMTQQDGSVQFAVSSEVLENPPRGYSGPIPLWVLLNDQYALVDYSAPNHRETPSYFRRVDRFLRRQLNEAPLSLDAIKGLDSVTGATRTHNALVQTITMTAEKIRQKNEPPPPSASNRIPLHGILTLIFLCVSAAGALLLRRYPNAHIRKFWLLFIVVTGGIWLNLQYSLDHLVMLLKPEFQPPPGPTPVFFLVFFLPLLLIFAGNIYCGWMCPFGALQELLGGLLPKQLRLSVPAPIYQHARRLKYILLALVLILLLKEGTRHYVHADPLVEFFTVSRRPVVLFSSVMLALSLFVPRFWCRILCPAGAFLSFFNIGAHRRFRLLPVRCCDYGVGSVHELDCIQCDRCRIAAKKKQRRTQPPNKPLIILFYAAAAAAVVWWTTLLWSAPVTPGEGQAALLDTEQKAVSAETTMRNVDIEQIKRKIQTRELSGKRAMYYHNVEE